LGRVAVGVEAGEVDRGAGGELFELARAQRVARGALHRGDGAVEGAAAGFQGGEAPQPVRVRLGG
jgi:hypothetical protein